LRDGFDCQVTAAFLAAGRTIANTANAAGVIAGLCSWMSRGVSIWLLAISLLAWVLETWFAARVAIDRELFRTLAENPEDGGDRLDSLLIDWKLVKTGKSRKMARSMAERSRGARRLLRMQAALLVMQLAMLAGALIARAVQF
jgi:hypothetical protein